MSTKVEVEAKILSSASRRVRQGWSGHYVTDSSDADARDKDFFIRVVYLGTFLKFYLKFKDGNFELPNKESGASSPTPRTPYWAIA